MTQLLSIIIPCLDDSDILKTVASIRDTAGPDPQIIIINDSSSIECGWNFCRQFANVEIVTNRQRCGSGPSRHIGSLYASGEWLLHTDSHMRFEKGWYEAFVNRLKVPCIRMIGLEVISNPYSDIVFCGTMIGLERDLSQHGEYGGATLNLVGPDPGKPEIQQVFQANWKKHQNGDEVPMLMGAASLVSRDWYLSLSPHRHLRSYGYEEEALSLKTWLSGGRIEMLSGVRIGHIFRGKNKNGQDIQQPYEVPLHHLCYNKLFIMWSMMPFDLVETLLPKLEKTVPRNTWLQATELIQQDWHLIAAERAESRFTMTFQEYCVKFEIKMP